MTSIETRKAQRFLFLRRLYDLADGDTTEIFSTVKIRKDLGWDDSVLATVTEYLKNEELLVFRNMASVSLTHYGLKVMEEALSHPDQPTPYFPSANVVLVVNGDFVINGDVIGHDKTTNNNAAGDIVGRDKSSSDAATK